MRRKFGLLGVVWTVLLLLGLAPTTLAHDGHDEARGTPSVPAAYVTDRTADIPEPPAGKIALRLSFDYLPTPLPGVGIEVFEPDPNVNSLWAMESLGKGQPLPVGKRLEDNVVFLEPGEELMVTVAYRNPTDSDILFLTLPHQETPGSFGPETWLTCFCLSFNYFVPAEGAWYRVIRLAVSPETPVGSRIDSLFTILTDQDVLLAMQEPDEVQAAQVETQPQSEPMEISPLAEQGESIAAQFGCAACHSANGDPGIGPTWKGLFGLTRSLTDGTEVTADEAYLQEAIVAPNTKIVQGFPPSIMPQDFGDRLSEDQIQAIIEYIKVLK